jgi:hypothetical protein
MACALLLGACSSAPYRYEPIEQFNIESRAETRDSENFVVRSAVLTDAESESLFGVPTHDRDVQPIWVEITNRSDNRARIAISSIDPKYFPPTEVAYFFRKKFSEEGWMALEERLINMALPRFVSARETVSGFVFTNHTPGTKAFNLDIFHTSLPPTFEQFTFFLTEPGFEPDYAAMRFRDLYSEDETVHVETEDLERVLADFGCCTQNRAGNQRGRPVNIFIVSDGYDLLRGLLRAGWLETPRSQSRDNQDDDQHLFGRPADGEFRTPRDKDSDRSELKIWRTPVMVDGKPLWAAQLQHAIGRRFPIGERLFGVHIDPDTIDGRNYVLQSFWYAQALEQWALSSTGIKVPQDAPEVDFQGNSWFSRDKIRVVLWISPTPLAMTDAIEYRWVSDRREEEDES